MKRATETVDSILGGALTLVQPRDGYRFSIEALLLGRFARVRARDRVLDLGAGCGVVSVMVAALWHPREVVAIEVQPELAAIAERNATLNRLDSVRVINADLRARRIGGLIPASFDLVVANPPYRALRSGRESPNAGRRIARGESAATLAQFVDAAKRYATNGAKVAFVFDAARSAELLGCLAAHSLEPKRIRFVHPRAAAPATTILVEARKGGGIEALIEPPLMLYDRPGVHSAEAREILGELTSRAHTGRGEAGSS
jgi:tRNA1Val (adenine37-N6)-methyltransferase